MMEECDNRSTRNYAVHFLDLVFCDGVQLIGDKIQCLHNLSTC